MTDPNIRKEMLEEIIARKKLGDKKFHSETSLQQFGEDEEPVSSSPDINKDPGVLNESLNKVPNGDDDFGRRRTMSQPGPVSGSLLTASAARAARKRPQRNVMYADPERNESYERQSPKLILPQKDDSGSATPIDARGSPLLFNGNYRNGDIKSLSSYRLYAPLNDMRGAATPRKRSVATMDAQSIRSVETQAPPSTDPHENKKTTLKYLTVMLSSMYAILLVTLGLIFYIVDPFYDAPVAVVYSMILIGLGFFYLIYLVIDIGRYKTAALKNQKMKTVHDGKLADFFRRQEEEFNTNNNTGDRTPELYRPPSIPPAVLVPLKHDYCFSQGRHSGSFYLKMGAAAFALGHLIHSVLLIFVQLSYFFDESLNQDNCVNMMQLVLDFLNPLYCFFQLYFIFKYSNVIVLRAQGLARFAFMHMIGSSLCFWISTIVRETVLSLTIYANSVYGNGGYDYNDTDITLTGARVQNRFLDVSSLYDEECTGSAAINSIFENVSAYLYPFSVEFNILIVAVYYIIWHNIGHCENDDAGSTDNSSLDDNTTICKIPTANEENDFTSNIVIYADCHASNRGMFAGLILIVVIMGMLIIGFVFSSVGDEYLEIGYLLNNCTKLGLHVILLFAAVFALNQTRKLDINEHPISLLDDILLYICLPAFFLETVLSLVATISLANIIYSIDFGVMVIQIIVQTALIVDGLRRCSNSRKLRRRKPGRELLIFLLIGNVGVWLFYTFSYKSPESLDDRYAYYGKVTWSILGHVTLPLIMFFRFHSSVCFADIWDSAYKPGLEH